MDPIALNLARSAKLTPTCRSAIGRKAAQARWAGSGSRQAKAQAALAVVAAYIGDRADTFTARNLTALREWLIGHPE